MKKQSAGAVARSQEPSGRETVLVATLGTAPSLLTSTVWALAHHESLLPHRIRVLTTRRGRERLEQQLFTPTPAFGGQTAWECLRRSLEKEGFDITGRLEFSPYAGHVRIFTTMPPEEYSPRELDDIHSQSENEQVADTMLEVLRGVIEDDTDLIASIAGGRKTVSALFYACVGLIGRSTDRIIHVLTKPPFDCSDLRPAFFFPSQPSGELRDREQSIHRACDAEVTIVEMPFVPLRNLFPKELGRMPGRFSALVAQYREVGSRQALVSLHLTVHLARPEIEVNGVSIKLGPREQLVVIFLAEQASAQYASIPTSYGDALHAIDQCRQRLLETQNREDFTDWRAKLNRPELTSEDVNKALSTLRKKARAAGAHGSIFIKALPEKGRFALNLKKEQIRIEP